MTHFIRNTQVKAMTSIWMAKQKARELAGRTKEALANREGQGTLDVAITVLISIVLGALILAGLYLIVDSTVLPTITHRIKGMFDYAGGVQRHPGRLLSGEECPGGGGRKGAVRVPAQPQECKRRMDGTVLPHDEGAAGEAVRRGAGRI